MRTEAFIQAVRGEKLAVVFLSLSLAHYNTNLLMCDRDTSPGNHWFVIRRESHSKGEFMPSTTDLIKGLWPARF